MLNKIFFSFLILISTIFLLLVLNFFFSSAPRYHEIVFNFEQEDYRKKKEKLIFYKSTNNKKKIEHFEISSKRYFSLNYSGYLINRNCGSIESGITELFFLTDKNGFRENQDKLYEETDYVLLGDSFVESICINKPNDLKTNLERKNTSTNYLNLGRQGTDYPEQVNILLSVTKETRLKNLVWFFYEGNDYEKKLKNFDHLNFKINLENLKSQSKENVANNINYEVNSNFNISLFFKFRVFLAELLSGLGFFVKYFVKYPDLIDYSDYEQAVKIAGKFLDNKNVENRYIYYLPAWQRLTTHKSQRFFFYKSNPQIIQLDKLKASIKEIAENNNFIFIDGVDFFMKLKNPLEVFHYGLNTHFNEKGYQYLADDLHSKIQ